MQTIDETRELLTHLETLESNPDWIFTDLYKGLTDYECIGKNNVLLQLRKNGTRYSTIVCCAVQETPAFAELELDWERCYRVSIRVPDTIYHFTLYDRILTIDLANQTYIKNTRIQDGMQKIMNEEITTWEPKPLHPIVYYFQNFTIRNRLLTIRDEWTNFFIKKEYSYDSNSKKIKGFLRTVCAVLFFSKAKAKIAYDKHKSLCDQKNAYKKQWYESQVRNKQEVCDRYEDTMKAITEIQDRVIEYLSGLGYTEKVDDITEDYDFISYRDI